jgi:Subtilase family
MAPDVPVRALEGDAHELSRRAGASWDDLRRAYPGVRIEPYFTLLGDDYVKQASARARTNEGRARASQLASYVAIECPRDVPAEDVARRVAAWPGVQAAYPEAGPTPPPVNPGDDPGSASQGYLDAAPDGIDARWVWASGASDGGGVGVVDVEQGWTLDHEDLASAVITIFSGVNRAYHGHGTAVLGEIVGVDNTTGVIGIAPAATARVVSQWRSEAVFNTAEAILSAVTSMNAGDVLLVEAQTTYPGAAGFLPVEVEDAVYDAIEFATSQGIVVVEAGGNGGVDLDQFTNLNGRMILNRGSGDFRDSGAILVGAASSNTPHQRLWFSNFGRRIDCFAWGENIATCGDGWTSTSPTDYTPSFGGTSGASPIISGAALLLQSWRVRTGPSAFAPHAVRQILSDAQMNTASANPPVDRIGVMPNLLAIAAGLSSGFVSRSTTVRVP